MEEFIAVLVLYKLSLIKSQTFLSLKRSLEINNRRLDIVVYDNTPEYNIGQTLQYENDNSLNIIYHPDYDNSGVSKAYNTAKNIGKKKGKKWIILLDQDTNFPETTVEKYIEIIKKFPNENLYAPIMLIKGDKIISPSYFILMRGIPLKHINTGINSLNNLSLINCGMCISITSFEKNQGYNERIQLDFSDHDFIKRFKKNIGNRFVVIDLKVYHELSTTSNNTLASDMNRFSYYLKGSGLLSSNLSEQSLVKIHGLIRASKLSLQHRNISFIKKAIKNIFS